MHFIRKDLSNDKKIVQVKWDERTEKWYPVAMNLMIRLMTDKKPVEFATELLLPFTITNIRSESDPWEAVKKIDPIKFQLDPYMIRFNYYFGMCGSLKFAKLMAKNLAFDFESAEKCILGFDKKNILEAASFHGDIGENKKTLDQMASSEQKLVLDVDQKLKDELSSLGNQYRTKFGMKFLVSAKDKSALEILAILKNRINKTEAEELINAKIELWAITKKRFLSTPINTLDVSLCSLLKKHKINGASIAINTGENQIQSIAMGEKIKTSTWFEMASLSKTIGSCFAMEFFAQKNIPLKTSVNSLLAKTKSTFRIKSSTNQAWPDQVTIAHLMSHSALNMHYVNGIPANLAMPEIRNFLDGNLDYGHSPIEVINQPGTKFQYSGGGFLVLEHLIEALENKTIIELTRPFLDKLGMMNFSFEQKTLPHIEYAVGFTAAGEEIIGTRKMFPSFAAGAMGSAHDLNLFLNHLTTAFHNKNGSGPISHDTAVQMLYGTDKGCMNFMGVKMGHGIFTADAGPNKLAIHQGANDGFRCLYIHCYDGPNKGLGITILCNGEINGVLFNSEVAQAIFNEFKMEGIDTLKFKTQFDLNNIPQDEIVNIGYKNLVFNAFTPALPETIVDKGPLDPLSNFNLAVGGKILEVSNQKFARAENLLSDHLPTFNPDLFGSQGKIMDSWETVRHNQNGCDTLVFELKKQSNIMYISISTKFHLGNQAQFVKIEGFDSKSNDWVDIVLKNELKGHGLKNILALNPKIIFSKIKVSMYPDGGLTRLGLYNEDLPENEKIKFQSPDIATSIIFPDEIAKTLKPLAAPYNPPESEIKRNWLALRAGEEFDVANLAFGGKMLKASNEHYGPAIQIISPYGPMNMFDGFESARSREIGHHEEVHIQLARPSMIHRIEMDFHYFINNNPFEISILGLSGNEWLTVVEKTNVKAFAGNLKIFCVLSDLKFDQLKIMVYPDGGINRVRVYSRL